MKLLTRILALLLSLLLLLPVLCGCNAQKKQEQKVIGTCAGYDVLYEELRYVTLLYKDMFESTYGEGIWENPETAERYRAELEETVWSILRNNYAVLATCADYMPKDSIENDSLTEAVDAEIDELIEAYGGRTEFEAELKELYMTENLMRFCLWVAQVENELYYVLTEDLMLIENDTAAFAEWLQDGNSVYVQHVYISNDVGDSVEENRALAEQVRSQLTSGEKTIDQLVGSAVNEDLQNVSPYFIVREVYTEQMESAAFALQNVGDVSEVIDTGDGYYVLVRVQSDEATLLSKIPSLLKSYQWAKLETLVDEKKQTLTVELNEYGKSIDLLEIE